MIAVEKSDVDRVLDCLSRAELRFVQELQSSLSDNAEVADGLDKLEYALEYVQNWDHDMPVCPQCGGIYCRPLEAEELQCLDCDVVWIHAFDREEYSSWRGDVTPAPTVDVALRYLQDALEILDHQDVASLVRSSEYLRESIKGLKCCLKNL
ncbi:MAG: hypothetical protein RQ754_08270 [Desulfuromonadales bacterium]|jgi:hypothetical protein|nr:hypothetical protein [Desulfuromonadales bacterium]